VAVAEVGLMGGDADSVVELCAKECTGVPQWLSPRFHVRGRVDHQDFV
jgi:hypothetical protein